MARGGAWRRSTPSGAIRRVICCEITERVLDAGQQVLEHLRVREHLGTVSEAAVEDATFALPPNPAHWEVQILLADRQNTARRARLLGIDPQQHVQTVAENRLLQLKRLVGNLKILAPERSVDRVAGSSTFMVITSPFHGWPPFSVPPSIRPNSGHWSYFGYCTKVAMASWIPTKPLPPSTKPSSEALSSGSSNSTPSVLLKQIASNCLMLAGRNISMSSLKTAS